MRLSYRQCSTRTRRGRLYSCAINPDIRELRKGKYQIFTTTGQDFVVKHRRFDPTGRCRATRSFFEQRCDCSCGHGWLVSELSVTASQRPWRETHLAITPSYVWRLQRRTELLFGIPIGVTSSTDRVWSRNQVTFELVVSRNSRNGQGSEDCCLCDVNRAFGCVQCSGTPKGRVVDRRVSDCQSVQHRHLEVAKNVVE